jgi:hypothetical protein
MPREPETQRAACQGGPDRKEEIISTDENNETARLLQQRRLCSRFGFAIETALAVASLAFAVAR